MRQAVGVPGQPSPHTQLPPIGYQAAASGNNSAPPYGTQSPGLPEGMAQYVNPDTTCTTVSILTAAATPSHPTDRTLRCTSNRIRSTSRRLHRTSIPVGTRRRPSPTNLEHDAKVHTSRGHRGWTFACLQSSFHSIHWSQGSTFYDSSYGGFFRYDAGAWISILPHGAHAFSLAAAVCF
jgi:hypothetical protein